VTSKSIPNLKRILARHFRSESCSKEVDGQIDCVWDRGAFGTITEDEQDLYISTMRRLLSPDFRYLLLVTEYDMTKFRGVPFSQPEDKVRHFYSWGQIQKVRSWIPDHLKLYQNHMKAPLQVKETTYFVSSN
jgi:hypothetical protein